MNEHCQCDGPGWCARHQIEKGERHFTYCKGTAQSNDCGLAHWLAWENGRLGATAPENPVLELDWPCTGGKSFVRKKEPPQPVVYVDKCRVGSRVKQLVKERYGFASLGCGGCKSRASKMDQMGCDGCRSNLDECASWLKQGAYERVWLRPLVMMFGGTVDEWARKLVEDAIALEEERVSG